MKWSAVDSHYFKHIKRKVNDEEFTRRSLRWRGSDDYPDVKCANETVTFVFRAYRDIDVKCIVWPVIPYHKSDRVTGPHARIVTKRRATSGFARIHPYAMAVEKRMFFAKPFYASEWKTKREGEYIQQCMLIVYVWE